ncbi:MAG: glycosyltransferase family 2 protein [Bacteroidales bacterium]|nr:glycosyltransferase family 2 protein [Bacteroidales bacterium]MCF8404591.1 glycosyltransferase family 2 protein [Bacteroidales bacterium]
MDLIILAIYGSALLLIFVYSAMQLMLVINYRQRNKTSEIPELFKPEGKFPFVTIQLPVFNELYVVERLIEVVSKFNYPVDRFEIQVLDDSTDESLEIARGKVEEIKRKGIQIELIERPERIGFKAGALDYGLKRAKGDFIAIFDADFIPDPDFLLKTIPYFGDENIGVVQTRWGHINKNYSLLTRLQAFGLDAHFTVEQGGRNVAGHFINFNGTAGVWRKKCIEDAGGWEHDTLTEDLDLSYRAQLNGWKFKFLEDVVTPAELPVVMSALKNQQFRWTKGGAENFVKMIPRILRNKKVSIKTKIHGIFHLFNSAIFLCVFATAFFSVPILFVKHNNPQYDLLFNISSLFLICTAMLMLFYWTSFQEKSKNFLKSISIFFSRFVMFLSTSMGLSLHNSVAVLEGYSGKKSSFIRTPKFNIVSKSDKWKGNVYISRNLNLVTVTEGLLALYFLFAIISSVFLQEYGLLPFHIMLFWGFGFVFWLTVRQVR